MCASAVLHHGFTMNTVARRLGVTRQSARRGIERHERMCADIGCTLVQLIPPLVSPDEDACLPSGKTPRARW